MLNIGTALRTTIPVRDIQMSPGRPNQVRSENPVDPKPEVTGESVSFSSQSFLLQPTFSPPAANEVETFRAETPTIVANPLEKALSGSGVSVGFGGALLQFDEPINSGLDLNPAPSNTATAIKPGLVSYPGMMAKTKQVGDQLVTTVSVHGGQGNQVEFQKGKDGSSSLVVRDPKGGELAFPFPSDELSGQWNDVRDICYTVDSNDPSKSASLSFTVPDIYGNEHIPYKLDQSGGKLTCVTIGSGLSATQFDDTDWEVSRGVLILNRNAG